MRSVSARGIIAVALAIAFLAPAFASVAAAQVEQQETLSYYPNPISSNSEAQKSLFMTVFSIALFVFVFVEGLLLYIVFRFRRNRKVPTGEMHRGHTKAEIMWTIVPAVILLFIGVISAQVMEDFEKIPETDATIKVTGFQWGWSFEYPDGSTLSTLNVSTGTSVRLDITSRDVIHAVWLPNVGIKLDAVPGRINSIWFEANVAGEYILKCAEYCYTHSTDDATGHHSMIARMGVCAEGTAGCLPVGVVSGPEDCLAPCSVEVRNNVFRPAAINITVGETVTWDWVEGVHTVTPSNPDDAPWGGTTGSGFQSAGATFDFTFTQPGEYRYHCIPHSFRNADGTYSGMVGVVNVNPAAP